MNDSRVELPVTLSSASENCVKWMSSLLAGDNFDELNTQKTLDSSAEDFLGAGEAMQ